MKGLASAAAVIASLAIVTGGLTLSNDSSSDVITFECEDLVDGDRVEVNERDESGDVERRLEIRAEADTRVRLEARSEERSQAGEDRRETRVELCGFVEFVDEDGDGALGLGDTTLRENLATFESISHRVEGGNHVLETTSTDGTFSVTATVPEAHPAEDAFLVAWSFRANPECGADATHFAVRLEQEGSDGRERTFLSAACGTELTASGGA